LFGDSCIADLIPTRVVATFVFGVVFGEGVERGVWSVEGHVEIVWLFRLAGLLEKFEREINIGDRGIEVAGGDLPWFTVKAEGVVSAEEIAGTAEVAEVALES
jgi:hypothetical protein